MHYSSRKKYAYLIYVLLVLIILLQPRNQLDDIRVVVVKLIAHAVEADGSLAGFGHDHP
jgi:hypothetical protein